MDEITARMTWEKLTLPQRAALIAALPLWKVDGMKGEIMSSWDNLHVDRVKALLKLDWNFMLGGKVHITKKGEQ